MCGFFSVEKDSQLGILNLILIFINVVLIFSRSDLKTHTALQGYLEEYLSPGSSAHVLHSRGNYFQQPLMKSTSTFLNNGLWYFSLIFTF